MPSESAAEAAGLVTGDNRWSPGLVTGGGHRPDTDRRVRSDGRPLRGRGASDVCRPENG